MILAIDTSTDQASVALLAGLEVAAEISWTARDSHSRHLAPSVRALLEAAGIEPDGLTGIIVAAGPGSFNGLRVGISFAKGLAMARGIPLVGLGTLDVIGFQASQTGYGADDPDSEIWALIPAGRSETYFGRYRGAAASWKRIGEYARRAVSDLGEEYHESVLLAGPGAASVVPEIRASGKHVAIRPPVDTDRRAVYLAELGRRYFDEGGGDQLETLEPLYLRLSSAEEKRATKE